MVEKRRCKNVFLHIHFIFNGFIVESLHVLPGAAFVCICIQFNLKIRRFHSHQIAHSRFSPKIFHHSFSATAHPILLSVCPISYIAFSLLLRYNYILDAIKLLRSFHFQFISFHYISILIRFSYSFLLCASVFRCHRRRHYHHRVVVFVGMLLLQLLLFMSFR